MVETITTVELTEEEAKRFIAFQKHYALVGLLDTIGAFNVKGGSVEIHFDVLGRIVAIDKHEHFTPKVVL